MRAVYFTGIFLIALSMVTLILLVLFPQAFPANMAATFSIITGKSPEQPKDEPSPVEEKQEPEKKKKLTAPRAQTPPPASEVSAAPAAPALAAEPPQRFPMPQDVAKGMTRTAVVAAFGEPEASISGADGQLRERLVYVDKKIGRKTFIFLANGSVSSVETVSQ